MANSPRYVGFIDPSYNVTLTDDSGALLDLTGCVSSSFTLTMINAATGLAQQGIGVWTIANQITNKGQVSYQWTLNDMATAGSWLVYTTVKLPSEPSPREFDPELIAVLSGTVGAGAAPPGVLPAPIAAALFFNVRDYGARGDGTTDDTVAINNTLLAVHTAGGGTAFGPFGNYLISAPLVIYSNTTLILANGTVITLAANANCNMIKNAAVTPQRTVSDAAITSGQRALTSATANFTNADIGRTVQVTGAWTGANTLVANIVSVQSVTACTLSIAATITVSNASCSIFTRDTNIEIAGGTWNRGNNGNVSSATVATNTTNLRHIDNISVHDATFVYGTLKSYNLSLVDVTNFHIKHIILSGPNTVLNTDGVVVDGPCQWGLVDGIYGTTGDDFVSFHTLSLDNLAGNHSDIVVSNLFPNQVGQAAFKSHADFGTTVRSLTVRGVHGNAVSGAVHIQDYVGPPSDSNMGDILVDDVDCIVTTNGSPLVTIFCNNPVGTITLKNLVWRSGTTSQMVYVYAGTTLRNLIIDGLQLESGTGMEGVYINGTVTNLMLSNVVAPDTTVQFTAIVFIDTSAVISTVSVRNAATYLPSNAQNAIVSNKGTVKTIIFDNIYMNNGGIVLNHKNALASCQALMNNITLDGAYQLAQLIACAADIIVSNLNIISINQAVLIACTTAGANLSIRGRGLLNPGNKTAFSRDLTQTVRINHPEMLADLSTLQNNAGDECTNTNGALASGTGRCIANGTNWKNIYTGAIF